MAQKITFLIAVLINLNLIIVANNDSYFLDQSVPTEVTAGSSFEVTITFQNTGAETWGSSYWLGSFGPKDNFIWGTNRGGMVTSEVGSGSDFTFQFTVTAPQAAGNYVFQWKMLQDGVEWFGAPSQYTIIQVTSAASNNARIVSVDVPATVCTNSKFGATVVVQNNGQTWTPEGNYWLGSENPVDNFTWGTNRAGNVSSVVNTNQNYSFSFTNTAPPIPGNYNFQWRMLQEAVEWFGEKTPNVVINVTNCTTQNAQPISVTAPDEVCINTQFQAEVVMQNTGQTTWNPDGTNSHKLGSQNPTDNTSWGTNRAGTVGSLIPPGQNYTFAFINTAPPTPGIYNFQWKMLQEGVEWFGQATANKQITVKTCNLINNAQPVSVSAPDEVCVNSQFQAAVVMNNNGQTAWTPDGENNYWLGSDNLRDNFTWGSNRAGVVNTQIIPGQNCRFEFSNTAPSTPGTYNFQWKMVQTGIEWFGQSTINKLITVKTCNLINNAQPVSVTAPDEVCVNSQFQATVVMNNNGQTTWTPEGENSYWLGSENFRDNIIWGTNRAGVVNTQIIPGQNCKFDFYNTAPSAPGIYNFQWKMLQDGIEWFGLPTVNKEIVVKVCPIIEGDYARIVSVTAPEVVGVGDEFLATIVVENAGTTIWSAEEEPFYYLGSESPRDNFTWGTNRGGMINKTVGKGETFTFPIICTAPNEDGPKDFQWMMLKDDPSIGGWFEEKTPLKVIYVTGNASITSRNSEFVSVEVPPVVDANETFTATIIVRNKGKYAWTPDSGIWLGSENGRDNFRWGTNRAGIVDRIVEPGETYTFRFQAKAPSELGYHSFQWQLLKEGVEWFGPKSPNKMIKVEKGISDIIGKVMFGYQGWFTAEGDSTGMGWTHYFVNNDNNKPQVDFWPDMSEYSKPYNTGLILNNGKEATLYSSYDQSTIDLHARWLAEYNLDGIFLQRFTDNLNAERLNFMNTVLDNVKKSCANYGRLFGVMYDITTASDQNQLEIIKQDWSIIHTITNSGVYVTYNDKKILAIYGIGFKNKHDNNPDRVLDFINYMKNTYNVSILIGVPNDWKGTGSNDAYAFSVWEKVYKAADIIMPWQVGNTGAPGTYSNDFRKINGFPDSEFLPVVFPGFSWKNLKTNVPSTEDPNFNIPRNNGKFYTNCSDYAVSAGSKMIYVAMFDEINEGTAMYKIAPTQQEVPNSRNRYLSLDFENKLVESDFYLDLARQTGVNLRASLEENTIEPPISIYEPEYDSPAAWVSDVDFNTFNKNLLIYPNPADETLTIKLDRQLFEKISVQIFTIGGQCILSNMSDLEGKIDVSKLSEGIYFIHIKYGDEITVRKICIR